MTAAEILEAAQAAGLCLVIDGADLVLQSASPASPAFIELLRTHKAEIIAAISAGRQAGGGANTAFDWPGWYEERATIRQFSGGHTREEAERLVWSEAEDRWQQAHGKRVPRDLCAGCRRKIFDDQKTLDLADGNRVHFGGLECLIRHGGRWRATAAQALVGLGLNLPVEQCSLRARRVRRHNRCFA